MRIGKLIRAKRKELHLTQVDLAQKAKLSHEFIGKLERCEVRNPGYFTLKRIAKILGLKAEELWAAEAA